MRKLFLRLQLLALGALLVSSTLAQSAGADKLKAAAPRDAQAKPDVIWSRQKNPSILEAMVELARLKERLAEKNPAVIEQANKVETLKAMSPWVVSIDFPGGPLSKLLAALIGPEEASFTVIGAADPADFATELPPFSLHNARLITVAHVVGNLLDLRGVSLRAIDTEEPNAVVCILNRYPGSEHDPAPRIDFTSFSLASFPTDGPMNIDNIVGTIRAAWELDSKHDPAALHLKFHPPTKMLLVSGPTEAIVITENVIAHLLPPKPR